MSGSIDLILEPYHHALDAVVSGNFAPMKELTSRRDDGTLHRTPALLLRGRPPAAYGRYVLLGFAERAPAVLKLKLVYKVWASGPLR